MARANRRRSAHLDTPEPEPTSQPPSPPQLPEADWESLTDTLHGLLRVEFPSPFTDLQLRCPKEAWLVVELARVPTTATNLRQQLLLVLRALTRLLTHAETARSRSRDQYEAYWTRVLTSDMVQHTLDDWHVDSFVRFVRAKGSHVALQWRGRSLNTYQVIDPLRKWLHTVVDVEDEDPSRVPVCVALRFENCQLTPTILTDIHELLRVPQSVQRRFLCGRSTLRELSFRSNILQAHMLHTIANMLDDPSTRRVDSLNLDTTMPDEPFQTPAYTAAFRRTIAVAVNMKTSVYAEATAEPTDQGVALSLEDCTIFSAAIVDGLADALVHATRPLRALSLACWHLPDGDTLDRVGRLLVIHLPMATDSFDVNLSCLRGPSQVNVHVDRWMMDARAQLITDTALAAQAVGKSLTCQPFHFAEAFHDHGDEKVTLSPTHDYDVRNVLDCGCCQIMASTASGEEIQCNVEPDSVASLRIDGVYVLREGAYGLIVDRCTRDGSNHGECTPITTLAAGLVGRIARLSVRHSRWNWKEYASWQQWLSWSLELKELNAEGCRDCHEFLRTCTNTDALVQVLNVTDCGLGPSELVGRRQQLTTPDPTTLLDVLELPHLWSLRFAHNKVDVVDMETLYDRLRATKTLALVDLRHTSVENPPVTKDQEQSSEMVGQIDMFLQLEHLSAIARHAFLLVLQRLSTVNSKFLPCDVVSSILAFAGAGERRRVVLW